MIRDVLFTLRSLRRAPGFTFVILVTLAVGIGPTTAIFSIVDALLLKEPPYRDSASLVVLWRARQAGDQAPTSGPDFADFRRLSKSFSDLAVSTWSGSFNVGEVAEPVRVDGAKITPNFFTLLGTPPRLGVLPQGTPVGGEKLAILSERLWKRAFGAREDIVGTTTRLNGDAYRIVAVMPAAFSFPEKAELWVPFDLTDANLGHRALHQYRVIGRLKPGVTPEQANAEVHSIAKELARMYPDTTAGIDARAVPIRADASAKVKKPLLVLLGAVVLLLGIACANAANLLMTRIVGRARELAVRAALGAGEGRLARELLTESVVLTTAGALLGLGIAAGALRLARTLGASYFPRPDLIALDGRVLLFAFAVATLTGLVFGLVPFLSRGSRFDNLRGGVRTDSPSGWSGRAVRESLVVGVLALSFILLIGAGALLQSFSRLLRIDVGVNARNLLTLKVFLPGARYPDPAERARLTQQIVREAGQLAGVDSVASVGGLPLENTMSGDIAFPDEKQFQDARRIASFTDVSPGYFRTAGIPLMEGRDFTDDDIRNVVPMLDALAKDTKAPLPPILVNATMAARYWPKGDAIGQVVFVGGENGWRIVGVVGDVKQKEATAPAPAHVYLPLGTPLPPRPFTLLVRSALPQRDLVAGVRRVLAGVDKDVPPYQVRTMDEVIASAFDGARFQTFVLLAFASAALVLALVGIYGVISYSVAQRTREIGIRVAAGATRIDVLRLVVGRVGQLSALGILIGCAAALVLSASLQPLLFETRALDPRVFLGVALVLVLTAAMGSALPARRAANVDPAISLRQD